MKKSQKILLGLLALCLVVGIPWSVWRQNVGFTQEELVALACKAADISEEYTVTILKDEGSPGGRMLCLAASRGPGDVTRFCAVSFRSLWWAGWGDTHNHLLISRGTDMYIMYDGSYYFFSANPQNTAIQIKGYGAAEPMVIPVTEHPFCYRLEVGEDTNLSGRFEYDFLDEIGASLSS